MSIFTVIMCFVTILCFGIVLWAQIVRLDELNYRLELMNNRQDWNQSICRKHSEWLEEIAEHMKTIAAQHAALVDATSCEHVSQFAPGEPHPFTPDAYVSLVDVV